jgi:hypothetical protein
VKFFLILFGVAFGIPALITAALPGIAFAADTTAIPEQAAWALMPVGAGGFAVVLRTALGPAALERGASEET